MKLNGEYLGTVDEFERFVDLPDTGEIFAEVIPSGEKLSESFFICDGLFTAPPPFLKVYLAQDGIRIYITDFASAERGINILAQQSLNGLTVTLLSVCGRLYASCDGQQSCLYELPDFFKNPRLTTAALGGSQLFIIDGGHCLCAISGGGKKLWCGQVESYSLGDMLELTQNLGGLAGYYAEREYAFDWQELTLNKSAVKKRRTVEDGVMHFAFFEGLLCGADCSEYLSEELRGATDALKEYLDGFTEVIVPHQSFFDKHGSLKAVGLAYPVKENLFEVKYFAVDLKDGKIDNVFSVDN